MSRTELSVSDSLVNLRDLGGLPAREGRRISSGVLLRSDQPLAGDRLPESVVWPPGTVIDLRRPTELRDEHPLAASGAVENLSLLPVTATAASGAYGTLNELYLMILEQGAERLGRVAHLVATGPAPVLIHCAAGKDRTGVAVAFLLRLMGVDRSLVVDDYTSSAAAMPGVLARASGRQDERWQPGAMIGRVPRELIEAPAYAMEVVLDRWEAHAGGVHGWAAERAGLSEETLDALSARLLS